MSNWNIETVERVYAAFGRREFPADLFEADAEWHTDPGLPRPVTHHGRPEVASYFERWIDAWVGLRAEPVELIARPGEQVVVVIAMGPPAGPDDSRATVAHLVELHQRRVKRVRVFGDRERALDASGADIPPRRAAPSLADRVWEREREYRGPAPESLAEFVRGLAPVGEALDLGCGDARLTVELRADRLTAADVSLVALKRARRRLPHATVVLLEETGKLPFETETFDLVLCADTLQEVQDVAQLVSELKRVLVPGGTLAITAPAYSRGAGLSVLRRGFESVFDPVGPALRYVTRRSLGDLLDLAGFHPIEIGRGEGRLLATARR
ncbi:MAG: hypothetical protein QOJ07_1864 [Thermoleophilaceae bacterium]|nr:hypothetical protein [Thermoleophilaceae bacterium]